MMETVLLVTFLSITAGSLIAGILSYDYDYSAAIEEDRLYREQCTHCKDNTAGTEYHE